MRKTGRNTAGQQKMLPYNSCKLTAPKEDAAPKGAAPVAKASYIISGSQVAIAAAPGKVY